MSGLLEVDNLRVEFTVPEAPAVLAVDDVSLALGAGDRLALVGESGSGKTTTLMAMLGLLPPAARVSGEIRIAGHDVLRGGERGARRVRWSVASMVFQGAMNALNPVRTIGWSLSEPLVVHRGLSRRAARARGVELLADVGLSADVARRYPHQLSGGMRQRAVIALALSCEPQLLLADEPTTALDALVQADILALLARLAEQRGLGVVLVTHDVLAAPLLCTRMAVMNGGRIVERGSCRAVLGDPRHPYTRALLAAVDPTLDGAPGGLPKGVAGHV